MFDDSRPVAVAALFVTSVAVAICLNPQEHTPHKMASAREQAPAPVITFKMATGLTNPKSTLVAPDGRIFVSVIGEFDAPGDGKIVTLGQETADTTDYVVGLNDPKGLALHNNVLYVADVDRICKIVKPGCFEVLADRSAFHPAPKFLNDLVADAEGNLYVSDSGSDGGRESVVFKVTPEGRVSTLIDSTTARLSGASGLLFEDPKHLLVLNFTSGDLVRVDVETRESQVVNSGFTGGDGLTIDVQHRLLVTDAQDGRLWLLNRVEQSPYDTIGDGIFASPADSSMTRDGRFAVIPDMKTGTVVWLPLP